MRLAISKPRHRAAACLLATLLSALDVPAGTAYLPITGPTPLRFEAVRVRPAVTSALNDPSKISDKFSDKSPGKIPDAATNAAVPPPETSWPVAPEVSAPPVVTTTVESSAPYAVRPVTDNPLVITPQMLVEYFRPAAGATNGAGVSVFMPLPVGFTPPMEKTPVSSRATYKTE